MERLSAKTSDLIDTGKSKGEAVVEKGKEKAREVEDKVRKV